MAIEMAPISDAGACGCDDAGAAPRQILTPLADAVSQLRRHAVCRVGEVQVGLEQADGAVLAAPAYARIPLPLWDNSAMDGYALRAADLAGKESLPLAGHVMAGDPPGVLPRGHCLRIFTGAPLPLGADTVIMQEKVSFSENGQVCFPKPVATGSHIRRIGEDVSVGSLLLPAGVRLGPEALALLAGQGIAHVTVRQKLRVAVLCSGDELTEVGRPLRPGAIYNSNAVLLRAALKRLGMIVVQPPQCAAVPDQRQATLQRLRTAAEQADVVITTGGVSVGEADHVHAVLAEAGQLHLAGIAIKPGKPFCFGELSGVPVLGLPGNPVAAMLTLDLLARPFLAGCQGRRLPDLQRFPLRAGFGNRDAISRDEYLRVRMAWDEEGPVALSAGLQSSAALHSAALAGGYLRVPGGQALQQGVTYDFLPTQQFRQ